ncbi:hypothetical protein [Arachidicoccus sp.]|uniref:putative polyvalent protein kinase domain-containing protein n=1 Tax=Arachidicoccus sp. TaxID=1872624 RepID=UPI003D238198
MIEDSFNERVKTKGENNSENNIPLPNEEPKSSSNEELDIRKIINPDGKINYGKLKEISENIIGGKEGIRSPYFEDGEGQEKGDRRNVESTILTGANRQPNSEELPNTRATQSEQGGTKIGENIGTSNENLKNKTDIQEAGKSTEQNTIEPTNEAKEMQGGNNFHQEKFGNGSLTDVYSSIQKDGLTKENLQKIEQYAKDIIEGKAIFKRFSPQEQRGFAEGGSENVEASIVAGRGVSARETQDERADRQGAEVEKYARKVGIWHKDTEETLTKEYGEPINSGHESLVYYDPKRNTVIKTSGIGQYRDLQDALDSKDIPKTQFPITKLDNNDGKENNGKTENATAQEQSTVGNDKQSGIDSSRADAQEKESGRTKTLKKRAKPTIKALFTKTLIFFRK